ncbi:MAG TPA: gamma carbonic anhydrase family protein [Chthoniobacteraceae bacterium]|jgi:carbonic anhydrase/acetyltransferase-like protein (isoleucine patch superfamily)|nr:gamma carbonic anhydrase family protein [Chthoniobacteraceae bacterium]
MDFESDIARHLGQAPRVHPSVFIAPGATVVGDVTIGEESSVWFSAVVRGDINSIVIGARTNIQDGAVVHLDSIYGTQIGDYVTVGHRAIVHACKIEDEVLVGMGAIVLDGAIVGAQSLIGAGALVTGGKVIPAGSLVLGSPAKVVRALTAEERGDLKRWAERYVTLSRRYLKGDCQTAR